MALPTGTSYAIRPINLSNLLLLGTHERTTCWEGASAGVWQTC
jgi:hypothetical protein